MKKFIVTILLVSAFTCGCTQSQNSNEGTISNANIQQTNQEQDLASNQQQTPETNSGSLEEATTVEEKLHPIDKAERDCIAKVYSTYDMNECGYKAMDSWSKEIDKYLGLLKTIASEEDYAIILKAQEDWKKYQDSEFVSINLIRNKQGTIYQTIAVGRKTDIVKQRALALKNLYKDLIE